jgi:hypothetical protein|nr:MAG TPA: hypothetical protein [Bacteriophage sp.]
MATIKVGGQLESVAVDEKLVDAAQVKDASRDNLSQKNINDELYSRTAQSSEELKGYVKKTDYETDKAAIKKSITDNKSAADTAIKNLQDGKFDKSQLIKSDAPLSSTDDSVYTSKKTDALIEEAKGSASTDLGVAKTELEAKINTKFDKAKIKSKKSSTAGDVYDAPYVNTELDKKQDKLTAGTNIKIEGSTISCTIDTTLYKVVKALPAKPASGDMSKIFLVPSDETATKNVYKEYIWKGDAWEQLGEYQSTVDLTPYFKKENIQKKTEVLLSTGDDKVPSSALLYKELAAKPEFAGLVKGHYAKSTAIPSNAADGLYLIDANASGTSGSYIVTVASGSVVAASEHLAISEYLYMTVDGHVYEAKNGAAWYDQGAIKTSTNDYTTAEKNKLAGIQAGANKTVVDPTLSPTSTNPVQNKIVNAKLVELQNEIAVINADKATFSLSRTSGNSLYFVGDTFTIKATATCSVSANTITIKCGNSTIASVQNAKTATGSQTIDPTFSSAPTTINFTAEAVIGSVKKSASFSVGLVNPMYVGAGAAYTAVVNDSHKQSVRTSASGTYNVTVASNGQYVFFVVPSSMTINKVTLSGFDFPLLAADTTSKSGYKIYKSANTYKAGTLTLVVS